MSEEKGTWIKGAVDSVMGTVKSIADPVEKIKQASDIGMAWADKFTEDKDEKREFALKIIRGVNATNNAESKSRHWFIAGWRPWIGWVCGLGLFFYYPVRIGVATYLWAKQVLGSGELIEYPLDAGDLIELVVSMLGLALYRTAEKKMGVSK